MNAFFKGAGAVLRKSWVWSLLLVLSSTLLVWFLGPLLAVDDYRFWQSPTSRLLTICGLLLLWGLAMVVVGARRSARADQPEHLDRHQRQALVNNEISHVRGRFKEALLTLKTSRRYGEHRQGWRNELPWYLLIGERSSGKTSLLAASGLQAPLDRTEAAFPGTAAYCDWYFADEAVMVEMAGRYLDQPDPAVDGAGWSTLLGLLKAWRRTRPLNGVVVTLCVDTLLRSSEHDLELHARHVRTRLQDIQQTLHVDVPVYLVLTQADRLAGFAEFFDALQGDSTEDVLGERLVAGPAGTDIEQVREAFEALLQRLGAELIPRLHQERNLERRGRMLDFPRQVARLGDCLCVFIEAAFSAHRHQRINGLRGFYLTGAKSGDVRPHFVQGLFNRVVFAQLGTVSQQVAESSEKVSGALAKALPRQALPDNARRALQRRFEPLHQLLDEEQNPGVELTQALRLLDELYLQLSTLSRDSSPERAAFKLARQRMDGQQPLLGNLRDAAARLPQPLRGWFEGIAEQSWRHLLDNAYGYVNQRYQSEVYGFYTKAIQHRYPFNAHAGSDVALDDFQAFFKPKGAMERFYDGYLRPFVSVEGTRYRLRALEGRSLPMSRSLLDQLTRAQTIRQGFFNEERGDWAVRFTLAPYSLDQAVSRATLQVGSQQLEYRHGPIVPMVFHWPNASGNGRTSLVLERGAERPLGIEKDSGTWSLFRFFELMQSEPASGRDAQILKADLAGLRANYLLTSQGNPSPFQIATWRTFRLPEQL